MGSDQSRPQRQPPAASPRPPHRRASPITVSSETIDGGYFTPPPGVYTFGKDWKSRVVRKLIVSTMEGAERLMYRVNAN